MKRIMDVSSTLRPAADADDRSVLQTTLRGTIRGLNLPRRGIAKPQTRAICCAEFVGKARRLQAGRSRAAETLAAARGAEDARPTTVPPREHKQGHFTRAQLHNAG